VEDYKNPELVRVKWSHRFDRKVVNSDQQ